MVNEAVPKLIGRALAKSSSQAVGRRPADQEDMNVFKHAVVDLGVGLDRHREVRKAARQFPLQGQGRLALGFGLGDSAINDHGFVKFAFERIDQPDSDPKPGEP